MNRLLGARDGRLLHRASARLSWWCIDKLNAYACSARMSCQLPRAELEGILKLDRVEASFSCLREGLQKRNLCKHRADIGCEPCHRASARLD